MPTVEATALARIETITAVDLFNPVIIDPILDRIREEALSQAANLDISSPSNRSDLASLAYKISRSKTFIDGQRKALVSDEKKRLAKIDAEGKRIWENLEALQSEVRKPLTDWENAEKQRVSDHEIALDEVAGLGGHAYPASSAQIQETIDAVKKYQERNWEEFHKRAADTINSTLHSLYNNHAEAEKIEFEQKELARLRAEAAERERREREERIAREATEKAEREAKDREDRAARELADREARLEREARQRDAQAKAEVEQAEQRARKAEADRIAAEERHEREKQEAIEAERNRVAEQARKAEAEAKAREKDKAHKAEIHSNALAALVTSGLSHEDAKKAVVAIASGLIPNVKVVY